MFLFEGASKYKIYLNDDKFQILYFADLYNN